MRGKIYHTKKGQPYIIKANGKARFIKKGGAGLRTHVSRKVYYRSRKQSAAVHAMSKKGHKGNKGHFKSKNIFGLNLMSDIVVPNVTGAASGVIDGVLDMGLNMLAQVPVVGPIVQYIPVNYLEALAAAGLNQFALKGKTFGKLKPYAKEYVRGKEFMASRNLTSGLATGSTSTGGW